MFKLFFIVTLLTTSFVHGQKTKSVELDIIGRYDKHADYTTRFGNRSYTNDTKLWGKSFGFNLNYFHLINKKLNFKAGLGYYNLGIDKIRQTTPFNLIATGRNIDYRHPSGIYPLFATSKYHYDNLSFTIGLASERHLLKKLDFTIGGDLYYLYSFSQLYHISYDNIRYRTNIGRSLGFGANSYIGVVKKFNKDRNYISPKVIVPIYQQLHGDKVFGEDNGVKMDKWLNGIGFSVSLGKYF